MPTPPSLDIQQRGGVAAMLLWLAGALVLVLMALSLVPCLRFLPNVLAAGEPGFTWEYDRRSRTMMVAAVEAGGAAERAGLQAGDRIVRLLGREPSPGADLWGPPGQWVLRPGDTLEVVVDRGGQARTLRWTLEKRPWYQVNFAPGWKLGVDQAFHACFLIAALATLGLGAWVLAQKPHLLAARAFAGLCWALCLAQYTSVVAHAPRETVPAWLYHLVFANDGWARLALAAAVYFFLVFPQPKTVLRQRPWMMGVVVFVPAVLLLAAHGALAHSMWRFERIEGNGLRERAVDILVAVDWWGYACPTTLLLLGLMLVSYRTARRGPERRQLAAFTLAAAPILLFAFASTLWFIVAGNVPILLGILAPLLFLAWPVALGYAIMTQGAFDVGRAMRRGAAYTLSTAAVAAFCFAVAALAGEAAIDRLGTGYTGIIIAAAAMLAHTIWGGVQQWVDRRFGRDRLAVLSQLETLSGEIAMILDTEALAAALTERVAVVLGTTQAVLFSRRAGAGAFTVTHAMGLDSSEAVLAELAGALPAVLTAGEPITTYAPGEDAPRLGLARPDVERLAETGLVLWVPLARRGETDLVLALGWKRGEDVYTRDEIALLRVLGSQAAAAWQNARLTRERESRARVEQEIAIGRAIQMRLLPASPLCFGPFRIDGRCEPATEVGGDFYNVFPLKTAGTTNDEGPTTNDERQAAASIPSPATFSSDLGRSPFVVGPSSFVVPTSPVALILGDVSGKGVPGALYMAVVSSLIEGLSQGATAAVEPAELLARANGRVYPKLRPLRMFVTAACAVLDVDGRTLTLANAGQTPPILWRAGGEPEFVRLAGLPLGARPNANYDQCSLTLEPGDLCIFTSDGLLDQTDPHGYEGLRRRLSPECCRDPEALLDALYTLSPEAEVDDRTAVVLSCGVWPPVETLSAPLRA